MRQRNGRAKAAATGVQKTLSCSVPVDSEREGSREEMDIEATEERAGSSNPEDPPVIGIDMTSADYYFDSNSHYGAHEGILKDDAVMKTYENVIYQNSFLVQDKVVLDVGAGTGILSPFCAKAGAKHVYAVESSLMADIAKEIVQKNGYSDVITVLKGKIEETELPVTHVDVIICEWMGYFLLYESMLNTVLYARDKWLNINGIMLPDKASLYLTAIEDGEYKEKKIDYVSKMAPGDVSFVVPFKLVAKRNDYIHALVAYFDVSFTECYNLMSFSTGPRSQATHWRQTLFYLEDVLMICEGEAVLGSITVHMQSPRDVEIMLEYSLSGQRCQVSRTQHYKMQ